MFSFRRKVKSDKNKEKSETQTQYDKFVDQERSGNSIYKIQKADFQALIKHIGACKYAFNQSHFSNLAQKLMECNIGFFHKKDQMKFFVAMRNLTNALEMHDNKKDLTSNHL